MNFKKFYSAPLAVSLALLLASCGGGGGGSDTPGGGSSGGSSGGSWLTFSPTQVDLSVLPATSTPFSVAAVSSKTFAERINVKLVDSRGVVTSDVRFAAESSLRYSVLMYTNPALTAGTYTGNFEVHLCFDDANVCARPVEGSPWQVPYTIRVGSAASLSFTGWEVASTTPGFTDDFGLAHRGGNPYVVAAGFYSKVMETWSSGDIGTTWTNTAIAGPTQLSRGFALASDNDSIYLSGGEELSTGGNAVTGAFPTHVWKFDGLAWQQKTAAASFPGRKNHVMAKVGGTLYVAGGQNATALISDFWKSVDDGVTWTKVSDALPAALGRATCALNWNNQLLLVGGNVVATSADGLAWTVHAPFVTTYYGASTQCAIFNGKLVINYADGDGRTFSSTDLENWQLERSPPVGSGTFKAPGLAAIGGKLMMITGTGTSQRTTYRTVP